MNPVINKYLSNLKCKQCGTAFKVVNSKKVKIETEIFVVVRLRCENGHQIDEKIKQ